MELIDLMRKVKRKVVKKPAKKPEQPVPSKPLEEHNPFCDISEPDKNKVWAFCAGHTGEDFRGNPKYLFFYVNNYRKDITAYWLCKSEDTISQVRALGFRAYQLGTVEAEEAMERTGVFVAEQVKSFIPRGLREVKYLNLYHGVGGKTIERCYKDGSLAMGLASKYIRFNQFYRNNQLFLLTSKSTEEDLKYQCGIDDDKVVRAGYPRCLYQKYYDRIQTFDHDLKKKKGLPQSARLVVYAPTFRQEISGGVFAAAIPDIEKLIDVCKRNNYLMIFKMHPFMENESQYLHAKKLYGDCPNLYFWENQDDFYEIIDQIDMGIIDYSSIYTDMVGAGVRHYLRYVFDLEEYQVNLARDYDEMTAGKKCFSFEELLEALDDYDGTLVGEELQEIYDRYWEYSGEDTFEKIVEQTLAFQPEKREFPTLYSFDVFDTLISRKVLGPVGIFYYVKEKIRSSSVKFPAYLWDNYPEVRRNAEANVREYSRKTVMDRGDSRTEIQFDDIFVRISQLYGLSGEQTELLKKWELEAELENVIPVKENIDLLKSFAAKGDTVVLISDMYLPKAFIQDMLRKADPMLAELPLFLSSELGWQKSNKTLFLEVYRSFCPEYMFGRWIHYGDSEHADKNMPRQMGIRTVKVKAPAFNDYEKTLAETIGTYDAYLAAASMARFRVAHTLEKEQFTYSYVSLYFVPYIYWAVHSAVARGDEILYFISRDGYHLKRIADELIRQENLPVKTKYIYGSRRAWRIPSHVKEIDKGFWGAYGNFVKVDSYEKLLDALNMDEDTFKKMFPSLQDMDREAPIEKKELDQMVSLFRNSREYVEYILEKAREGRESVCGYLRQEMDTQKQFSVVEYWGRGYTQECFVRLWHEIVGEDVPVPFYYSRSILPTQGAAVRYNFTSNFVAQMFIEAIFANIPYKTIEQYEKAGEKWQPVIVPADCDRELFHSMEIYLVQFMHDFCSCDFLDRETISRALFDFSLNYFRDHAEDEMFVRILAPLKDNVAVYAQQVEYAKQYTMEDLDELAAGAARGSITKNSDMSYARADEDVQERFLKMFQLSEADRKGGGKRISDENIIRNDDFKAQYQELKRISWELACAYREASILTPLQRKIVICVDGELKKQTSFFSLMPILEEQTEFQVEILQMKQAKEDIAGAAKILAEAQFIILAKNLGLLGQLEPREGSRTIQIGEAAFPYLLKGYAKKYSLVWESRLEDLKWAMPVSVLQMPSEELRATYERIYRVNMMTDYSLKGNCQTDIFFQDSYREAAKEKLYNLFPEAQGKKVIFYMPYYRYRSGECLYMEFLNMDILKEKLGEDYAVIVHLQDSKRPKSNEINIAGFSKDLTRSMPLREQMLAADIIVGDYRDAFFEAVLLRKPIYVTCRDLDNMALRETFFDYEEIIPGVPVSSTEDLVRELRHADTYDYSAAEAFRKRYLTYCDGKSAQRLFEYMKSSALPAAEKEE